MIESEGEEGMEMLDEPVARSLNLSLINPEIIIDGATQGKVKDGLLEAFLQSNFPDEDVSHASCHSLFFLPLSLSPHFPSYVRPTPFHIHIHTHLYLSRFETGTSQQHRWKICQNLLGKRYVATCLEKPLEGHSN